MSLTCELSKSGKEMRWGLYKKHVTQRKSREFNPRLSYNMIMKVFDGMWNKYNLFSRNCADWAREFYGIICELT
ncbi:unnamed protein product [Meloidogyne enterolobii]|uniref:Uncharacterized protein n=1 Tax=Meloidogyne enterolobii TaxID=390850 RepID=A0ACB1AGH1_MELEN